MAVGLGATSLLQHESSQPWSIRRQKRAGKQPPPRHSAPQASPFPGGHQFPSQWHRLLCGSLRPLWCLVASPTHGQRDMNRRVPDWRWAQMELKSRQGSYLPYVTIGYWFWQGTCGIRTRALGEGVFVLSPCQWRASQGCTWPMLTQHCPESGQVLNFLTTRCSSPVAQGIAARHIPMMAAVMWSPVRPLPILLGTTVTAKESKGQLMPVCSPGHKPCQRATQGHKLAHLSPTSLAWGPQLSGETPKPGDSAWLQGDKTNCQGSAPLGMVRGDTEPAEVAQTPPSSTVPRAHLLGAAPRAPPCTS